MAGRSDAGNGRPRSCIHNQGRRRDAGQHLLRRMSVGYAFSRREQFDIDTDFQGQWSPIAKPRVGQELMSCLHFSGYSGAETQLRRVRLFRQFVTNPPRRLFRLEVKC